MIYCYFISYIRPYWDLYFSPGYHYLIPDVLDVDHSPLGVAASSLSLSLLCGHVVPVSVFHMYSLHFLHMCKWCTWIYLVC